MTEMLMESHGNKRCLQLLCPTPAWFQSWSELETASAFQKLCGLWGVPEGLRQAVSRGLRLVAVLVSHIGSGPGTGPC